MALVLHGLSHRRSGRRLLLLVALVMLWSPFVAVGLVPFVALVLVVSRGRDLAVIADLILAPIIAVVAVLYLTSAATRVEIRWIWELADPARVALAVVLFILLEVGCLFLLTRPMWGWNGGPERHVVAVAAAVLLVAPVAAVGVYNNLAARTTIPALVVVWVTVARRLALRRGRDVVAWVLVAVLVVGAVPALGAMGRSIAAFDAFPPRMVTTPGVPHLAGLLRSDGLPLDVEAHLFLVSASSARLRLICPLPPPDRAVSREKERGEVPGQ